MSEKGNFFPSLIVLLISMHISICNIVHFIYKLAFTSTKTNYTNDKLLNIREKFYFYFSFLLFPLYSDTSQKNIKYFAWFENIREERIKYNNVYNKCIIEFWNICMPVSRYTGGAMNIHSYSLLIGNNVNKQTFLQPAPFFLIWKPPSSNYVAIVFNNRSIYVLYSYIQHQR